MNTEPIIPTKEERHELLTKAINDFPLFSEKNDEQARFPFENIEKLKEIGYPKYNVAKEDGGYGVSLSEWLQYQMLIAEKDGATSLAIGWHMGLMQQLRDYRKWDSSTYQTLIKEVVEKGALINAAATEAATGSPTRGGKPTTTARKEAGQWIINGRKTFTTMAPVLDYFLVSATIEDEDKVGNFLIPKDTVGLEIEETWNMLAMRATASHDLHLTDVKLDLHRMVEYIERKKVAGWLLHIPACYLGIAKAAHRYAIQFAKSYSPNSIQQTISELPNVQAKIGEAELLIRQSEAFLFSVSSKWDQTVKENRDHLQADLGAVKHGVVNQAIQVVDLAMRVVGAQSLKMDSPLQRYYRDVRAGLHNPPMDDMTIQLLAQEAIQSTS
ncbi:acyl-CoA dehydrogenase family protein [Alkalihalobacillus sp. 1P02AB]|uniref:acyl-CoA dehydrogenase family protein n=1 Tax=Alkalihalobacillus sp. 1P02AB TaxID=3132260 RepID=UPI0039A65C9F